MRWSAFLKSGQGKYKKRCVDVLDLVRVLCVCQNLVSGGGPNEAKTRKKSVPETFGSCTRLIQLLR